MTFMRKLGIQIELDKRSRSVERGIIIIYNF